MDLGHKLWAVPSLAVNKALRKRISKFNAVVLLCLSLAICIAALAKPVVLEVDGRAVQCVTFSSTVGGLVANDNLHIYPEDGVTPARTAALKRGMKITVTRSIPIVIILDGKVIPYRTLSATVGQALAEAGKQLKVNFTEGDIVEPGREQKISAGLYIKVKLATAKTMYKDLIVQNNLPYKIVSKQGDFPVGLPDKLLSKGTNGLEEQVIRVIFEDGREVDSTVLSRKVIRAPIDQVTAKGSQTTISIGGQVINFKRAMVVRATGYCIPGGKTSVGQPVRRGVVAVDPKVIPYYTKLWIEGYGSGVALDSGSAIKGIKIDLYFESMDQAVSWGARDVIIYIM